MDVRSDQLIEKLERQRAQMAMLKALGAELEAAPEDQVPLTDADARAPAICGLGSGIVAYNVQTAVEGEHHLIDAHVVIMDRGDKCRLGRLCSASAGCRRLELTAS